MKKLIAIVAVGLALAGCTRATLAENAVTAGATAADIAGTAPPSVYANKTILDEKVGIAVELAYKAWRVAFELGLDSGVIHGAKATALAAIDNKAYAATIATQSAYRASNATSYRAAADQAIALVRQALAVLKGQ